MGRLNPPKKTLVVRYVSGRTERLKFESPTAARDAQKRLLETAAVTTVDLI